MAVRPPASGSCIRIEQRGDRGRHPTERFQWDAPDAEQEFGIPILAGTCCSEVLTSPGRFPKMLVQPVPFDDFFVLVELFTVRPTAREAAAHGCRRTDAWQAEQVVDTEAYLQLRVRDEPLPAPGSRGLRASRSNWAAPPLARQVVKGRPMSGPHRPSVLSCDMLLAAYARGWFLMGHEDARLAHDPHRHLSLWRTWSPGRTSRRILHEARSGPRDPGVHRSGCAVVPSSETWITEEMIFAYTALHELGHA